MVLDQHDQRQAGRSDQRTADLAASGQAPQLVESVLDGPRVRRRDLAHQADAGSVGANAHELVFAPPPARPNGRGRLDPRAKNLMVSSMKFEGVAPLSPATLKA